MVFWNYKLPINPFLLKKVFNWKVSIDDLIEDDLKFLRYWKLRNIWVNHAWDVFIWINSSKRTLNPWEEIENDEYSVLCGIRFDNGKICLPWWMLKVNESSIDWWFREGEEEYWLFSGMWLTVDKNSFSELSSWEASDSRNSLFSWIEYTWNWWNAKWTLDEDHSK